MALNKKNHEEHPWSNLAQNSDVPRSHGDYITQVSEEMESRVKKKLSGELSRTKSRIFGLSLNPLVHGQSGLAPEISPNTLRTEHRKNENDCQGDPHPEAIVSQIQTSNSGPDDVFETNVSLLKIFDFNLAETGASNYPHHVLLAHI